MADALGQGFDGWMDARGAAVGRANLYLNAFSDVIEDGFEILLEIWIGGLACGVGTAFGENDIDGALAGPRYVQWMKLVGRQDTAQRCRANMLAVATQVN